MLKKVWNFIWHDDSVLSWIVNVILALLIVKFLVYPGLGLVLGTSYPVVAVVSSSMHHNGNFDQWYDEKGDWYQFEKEDMRKWSFHNGFNKGDIMILKKAKNVKIGDVIVFYGNSNNPIIHRIVFVGENFYQTKGDNNIDSFEHLGEKHINSDKVIGKAIGRVPLLGYVKIVFSEIFGGKLK